MTEADGHIEGRELIEKIYSSNTRLLIDETDAENDAARCVNSHGLYHHAHPYRHTDFEQMDSLCLFVEQSPMSGNVMTHVDCHYCRMAAASMLANTGHGQSRVAGDMAEYFNVPEGASLPTSMVLRAACEKYDDVAVGKMLDRIEERATDITLASWDRGRY